MSPTSVASGCPSTILSATLILSKRSSRLHDGHAARDCSRGAAYQCGDRTVGRKSPVWVTRRPRSRRCPLRPSEDSDSVLVHRRGLTPGEVLWLTTSPEGLRRATSPGGVGPTG